MTPIGATSLAPVAPIHVLDGKASNLQGFHCLHLGLDAQQNQEHLLKISQSLQTLTDSLKVLSQLDKENTLPIISRVTQSLNACL